MDDKKKKLALIGLVVAILAIGAFQFTSGSSEPDKKVASKPAKKVDQAKAESNSTKLYSTDEGGEEPLVVAAELPVRDPFDGTAWQPQPETKKAAVDPIPAPQPRMGAKRGGNLPPFNVDGVGQLPTANGGTFKVEPGKAAPPEAQFGYGVSGVITGARPAAVITDGSGNQRLIAVGGQIDGDSRIVAIERGKVTIRFRNRTLTLHVGGTSNDK